MIRPSVLNKGRRTNRKRVLNDISEENQDLLDDSGMDHSAMKRRNSRNSIGMKSSSVTLQSFVNQTSLLRKNSFSSEALLHRSQYTGSDGENDEDEDAEVNLSRLSEKVYNDNHVRCLLTFFPLFFKKQDDC